jgi:hypothetical protein
MKRALTLTVEKEGTIFWDVSRYRKMKLPELAKSAGDGDTYCRIKVYPTAELQKSSPYSENRCNLSGPSHGCENCN